MAKIILFKKKSFDGDALILTDSNSDLHGTGFNDDISSVVVVEGSWNLCNGKNFSGNAFAVSNSGGPTGDGCYLKPDDWNQGSNNKITSIELVSS